MWWNFSRIMAKVLLILSLIHFLNSPQKGLVPFPDGSTVWVAGNCRLWIRCGRCARQNVTYPEKDSCPAE